MRNGYGLNKQAKKEGVPPPSRKREGRRDSPIKASRFQQFAAHDHLPSVHTSTLDGEGCLDILAQREKALLRVGRLRNNDGARNIATVHLGTATVKVVRLAALAGAGEVSHFLQDEDDAPDDYTKLIRA